MPIKRDNVSRTDEILVHLPISGVGFYVGQIVYLENLVESRINPVGKDAEALIQNDGLGIGDAIFDSEVESADTVVFDADLLETVNTITTDMNVALTTDQGFPLDTI